MCPLCCNFVELALEILVKLGRGSVGGDLRTHPSVRTLRVLPEPEIRHLARQVRVRRSFPSVAPRPVASSYPWRTLAELTLSVGLPSSPAPRSVWRCASCLRRRVEVFLGKRRCPCRPRCPMVGAGPWVAGYRSGRVIGGPTSGSAGGRRAPAHPYLERQMS